MPRRGAVREGAVAAVLAAVLALGGAGCADESAPARAANGRVKITLDDFFIAPQRVRADAGRITFDVVDHGSLGHTLRVRSGERLLFGTKTLLPGGSATVSGTLKPGTYDLVCILGNHEVLGMHGTLTVR
jgi:plastocyanin